MNNPSLRRPLFLAALALSVFTSFSAPKPASAFYFDYFKRGNLVQELEKDGRFGVLLSALEATGLDEAVASGKLTVFAPTDEAFQPLIDDGTIDALLEEEGLVTLTNILLYHVVEGRSSTYRLERTRTPSTLLGPAVILKRTEEALFVNDSEIIDKNNWASNGYFHAVDAVLLPPDEPVEVSSILDVLRLDGRFGVLLTALEATGLDEAVATGELTLFAPTDEAFQPLIDDGTIEALLAEEDLATLTSILLYHAVEGRQKAISLLYKGSATTLQGTEVTAKYRSGGVFINDSRIISADGMAPNGIVHILDAVLMPMPSAESLVDLLRADGRFNVLLTALEATGLDEAVAAGDLTLFAPTDEAFQPLIDDGTIDALLAEEGLGTLTDILLYHVVAGVSPAQELVRARRVETLQGSKAYVWGFFGRVYVNRSKVIDADLRADDGIVHVINHVLMPPKY